MVTYNDIARAAGVSPAKVSRALNSNKGILPDEAERIKTIANGLGYKGNRVAHCIATGRSRIIGCLIHDLTNPYVCDLVAGIEQKATANDYAILLSDARQNEWRNLNRLVQYQVDGLILTFMPTEPEAYGELNDFMESGGHVVAAFESDNPNISSLCVHHRTAANVLVRNLAAKGHRRIAFAGGIRPDSSRLLGYLDGMEAEGLEVQTGYVMVGPGYVDNFDGGVAVMDSILSLVQRPTAVVTYNDFMAFGVVARAGELGIGVPEDLSVCGFDGISTIRISGPKLVTVAADNRAWGAQLTTLMLERFAGGMVTKTGYPWTLIDGDTVKGIC